MLDPRRLALLLLGAGWITGGLAARADDPPPAADSRIFTAADLLDDPFVVDFRAADYTFWAWTDGSIRWSEVPDSPPDRLTFRAEPGERGKPRWQQLARRSITIDAQPVISFGDAPGRPVPALLALSTDRDFDPARALDLIRGNVRSTGPTADARRGSTRTEERGVDFDPPGSLDAWRLRAEELRDQLRVNLGLWPEPARTDLNPRIVGTLDRSATGYAIDRVVLETSPGLFLAGNIFRPAGSDAPSGTRRPAVLCPHGHSKTGRFDPDVQARCVHLAQLGCVVFLYDMVGFGDSAPFGHAWASDRLRRWGLSLAGLQTWNSLRALDYLAARADVDPARLAVTGESGGATQTLLLTALDPRVKVAAPVVMVSDGYQGGCACENAPGLRWTTGNVEIAALAAPRPLIVVGATGDWTARTITNAYPTLQLVYGRYGASDRVAARVFDFPHNYNATSRAAVYDFFGRWLLGLPEGTSPRPEDRPPVVESADDLRVYRDDCPYPSQALAPEALADASVGRLAARIARLGPGDDPTTWAAARARLGTAHRARVPVDPPSPRAPVARLIRASDRADLRIQHFVVGRVADGGAIPVVVLADPDHPAARGAATVVATERGLVELTEATGAPSPLVRALLDQGQSVIGYDPFLVGESVDPADPTATRPGATHFHTYNPSLALDRMRDLAVVVSWARSRAGVVEVHLVAQGQAGVLALLARPGLDGLGRTVVDTGRFTFVDGSTPVPPGLDLPGLFQFGGLPGAAALVAPAPLWITGSGSEFDPEWARRAYDLAGSPGQLRVERTNTPESIARWIATGSEQ